MKLSVLLWMLPLASLLACSSSRRAAAQSSAYGYAASQVASVDSASLSAAAASRSESWFEIEDFSVLFLPNPADSTAPAVEMPDLSKRNVPVSASLRRISGKVHARSVSASSADSLKAASAASEYESLERSEQSSKKSAPSCSAAVNIILILVTLLITICFFAKGLFKVKKC